MNYTYQASCHTDSWMGFCCCTCQHLVGLRKHPWNQWDKAKGHVSEVFAYVCMNPEFDEPDKLRTGVFFEVGHGLCEGYEPR